MKGAACATVAAARRCCFRASASCARLGPRREEPFAAFRWHGGGANEHRRLLPKAVRQFAPLPTPSLADPYCGRSQTYLSLVGLRQIRVVCGRIFSGPPGAARLNRTSPISPLTVGLLILQAQTRTTRESQYAHQFDGQAGNGERGKSHLCDNIAASRSGSCGRILSSAIGEQCSLGD